jgi:hypothetical protein
MASMGTMQAAGAQVEVQMDRMGIQGRAVAPQAAVACATAWRILVARALACWGTAVSIHLAASQKEALQYLSCRAAEAVAAATAATDDSVVSVVEEARATGAEVAAVATQAVAAVPKMASEVVAAGRSTPTAPVRSSSRSTMRAMAAL